MLDVWKELEKTERAVGDAESDEEYALALKELEEALERYTDMVRECIGRCHVIEPAEEPVTAPTHTRSS